MSSNISEKNHQLTQISNQTNRTKDKEDLSSTTLKKSRNDTILHNLGDTIQSGSSKWVEVNHIGTQTSPHDHRRNVVRPSHYMSISTPLLERKRTEKERVFAKTSETEEKGLVPQTTQRGKKIKINLKSNSHPLHTERKRKAAKRLKESDNSENRRITESSRTIRGQPIGPGSSNRVRKKRARRSSTRKSSASPNDPNRCTHTRHQSSDTSSRRKSVKTLYRSKFSNTNQSETTFLDASSPSEIGHPLPPETSKDSNCVEKVVLPEAKITTTPMECSTETTSMTENEETSTEMPLENRIENTPTSPSGAGDFNVEMPPVSPNQSSLDYTTEQGSTTTDSTFWSPSSHEDVSPKSSLLSFSGEVLRIRYSNPRLVLHALNPSGDRPKWPFDNNKKALEVTCKAREDMVFLFDSQFCDNALACWDKTYKAKYCNVQPKRGGNSAQVSPKTSSARRNTFQQSRQSSYYSKPLNSETGMSMTEFGSSSTAINNFSQSGRQSITYCTLQDVMNNRSGYTFGNTTTTYFPKLTSMKDTGLGPWTSQVQNGGSYEKLCVGHNTCLDLTRNLPKSAGYGKLSSHLRNGKFMHKYDSFVLQGDSVWKNSSSPRSVDPAKKSRGSDDVVKKFNTTIRTTGGREIFVRTNKDISQGNTVIQSKRGTSVPVSAVRTSRGNNGFLENRMLMSSGGESGIWEIGTDVAQFACNTILISKAGKECDQLLSKTEPLLLGHFRSGVSKRNINKAEKIVCSAVPSLEMPEEPKKVDIDTTLGTPSYGSSIST